MELHVLLLPAGWKCIQGAGHDCHFHEQDAVTVPCSLRLSAIEMNSSLLAEGRKDLNSPSTPWSPKVKWEVF